MDNSHSLDVSDVTLAWEDNDWFNQVSYTMATTGERGLGGAGETSSGMAGQRGICKYNQTGFCKFKGSCPNIHDNEICNVRNCSPNLCTKRHPKECRYFADYKYCKFRACAFAHSERIEKGEVNALREEINYMKQ